MEPAPETPVASETAQPSLRIHRPSITTTISESSPSKAARTGVPLADLGAVDWANRAPKEWLSDLLAAVKSLVYNWCGVLFDVMAVHERLGKKGSQSWQLMKDSVQIVWMLWKGFKSAKAINADVLVASPIYYDYYKVILKMRKPYNAGDASVAKEVAALRSRANKIHNHFMEIMKIVDGAALGEDEGEAKEGNQGGETASCFSPIPPQDDTALSSEYLAELESAIVIEEVEAGTAARYSATGTQQTEEVEQEDDGPEFVKEMLLRMKLEYKAFGTVRSNSAFASVFDEMLVPTLCEILNEAEAMYTLLAVTLKETFPGGREAETPVVVVVLQPGQGIAEAVLVAMSQNVQPHAAFAVYEGEIGGELHAVNQEYCDMPALMRNRIALLDETEGKRFILDEQLPHRLIPMGSSIGPYEDPTPEARDEYGRLSHPVFSHGMFFKETDSSGSVTYYGISVGHGVADQNKLPAAIGAGICSPAFADILKTNPSMWEEARKHRELHISAKKQSQKFPNNSSLKKSAEKFKTIHDQVEKVCHRIAACYADMENEAVFAKLVISRHTAEQIPGQMLLNTGQPLYRRVNYCLYEVTKPERVDPAGNRPIGGNEVIYNDGPIPMDAELYASGRSTGTSSAVVSGVCAVSRSGLVDKLRVTVKDHFVLPAPGGDDADANVAGAHGDSGRVWCRTDNDEAVALHWSGNTVKKPIFLRDALSRQKIIEETRKHRDARSFEVDLTQTLANSSITFIIIGSLKEMLEDAKSLGAALDPPRFQTMEPVLAEEC